METLNQMKEQWILFISGALCVPSDVFHNIQTSPRRLARSYHISSRFHPSGSQRSYVIFKEDSFMFIYKTSTIYMTSKIWLAGFVVKVNKQWYLITKTIKIFSLTLFKSIKQQVFTIINLNIVICYLLPSNMT